MIGLLRMGISYEAASDMTVAEAEAYLELFNEAACQGRGEVVYRIRDRGGR